MCELESAALSILTREQQRKLARNKEPGGGGGFYYGQAATTLPVLQGSQGPTVVVSKRLTHQPSAPDVTNWLYESGEELQPQKTHHITSGYSRIVPYKNGNLSVKPSQREAPLMTITNVENFEKISPGSTIVFKLMTMKLQTNQAGSVLAVGQIVEVKGFGFAVVTLVLQEVTDTMSPSRQQSIYMAVFSGMYGGLLVRSSACVMTINDRPSQMDMLAAFLDATRGDTTSYPLRSPEVTVEAHGIILHRYLEVRGAEWVADFLSGRQVIGDKNAMGVQTAPAAMVAAGDWAQSRSQALLYPYTSRIISVCAHGNLDAVSDANTAENPAAGASRADADADSEDDIDPVNAAAIKQLLLADKLEAIVDGAEKQEPPPRKSRRIASLDQKKESRTRWRRPHHYKGQYIFCSS